MARKRTQLPAATPVVEPTGVFPEGPKRLKYTPQQAAEQTRFIEDALVQRIGDRALAQAARDKFGIGQHRVSMLVKRVRERWATEDAASRPAWKANAIRAIERDMAFMRLKLAAKPELLYRLLLGWHSLLADLQGTRQPIEVSVDVRVSASLTAVIANMTAEEVADRLARARENRRYADEYRRRVAEGVVPAPDALPSRTVQ